MTDAEARRAVVDTCQALDRLGLTRGTSGNVSLRTPGGLLISPTGIPYDRLTPDQVVPMSMDGSHQGSVRPSSEWRFHRDILARRPEMAAVVHTHSVHATATAILGLDIPPLHYGIAAAGGSTIRCAPYALFGTQALSDAALAALQDRRACLLAHHGVIACGRTLPAALSLAVTVEELAQQFLLCRAQGSVPLLDDAQMAEVLAAFETYGQQPAVAERLTSQA